MSHLPHPELHPPLDDEKERLRLVIEGTRLGMWDWNPQTDAVSFNDLWAEMLGHTLDEIPFTLESWSSRVHPDDLDGCYRDIRRHMNGETAFYENLHRMRHKDGSWRYILDRGQVVARDAQGRPTRFTGTHTDITAQKEAELAAQDASRAKGLFLAKMSHEIRTPLHGMLGLVELLDDDSLTEVQRDTLQLVSKNGEALLVLLNDLLDVTKAEAGRLSLDPRPFDLHALVREQREVFGARADAKGVACRLSLGADVPRFVVGDDHRLRQILSNLLSNAVKFTDAGEVAVEVSAEVAGDLASVQLVVRDTGVGIARPERVWEVFAQEDASIARRYGGSGLGLAIVRQLVELFGGQVEVASTQGVGTTFTLTLPMEVASGLGARRGARAGALPDLEVLVVDDNAVNRRVAQGMLERWGISVTLATTGEEAVSLAFERAAPFNAVLMDLHMPGMDGMEATRRLRRRYPASALPVVALSADAFEDTRRACLEAGMNGFLEKPFKRGELLDLLYELAHAEA